MAPNRRIPLRWGRKRRVWWFTRRVKRARLAEQHDQAEDDGAQPRSASASDGTRTPRWASRTFCGLVAARAGSVVGLSFFLRPPAIGRSNEPGHDLLWAWLAFLGRRA